MAADARDAMVVGAMDLLAAKGLEGTSLSDVLEASGAPRGSIYHHFPRGKDELIAAAVDLTGRRYTEWMDRYIGASADEVVGGFLQIWRHTLLSSDLRSGCPVLAVTVSADADGLIDHARDVFRASNEQITHLLTQAGVRADAAAAFAVIAVAACEGAVVLARAERSIQPFETVAAHLMDEVVRLPRG